MPVKNRLWLLILLFFIIAPVHATVVYYTIESPHPYPNNYDNTWTITDSGATKIRVHFSKIETESNYDYVYIYDGSNNLLAVYDGTYYNFWSPWASGDTIKVRLESDYSVTKWGFKIDKKEYEMAAQNDAWDPTDDSSSSGTWITPSTTTQQHGPHSLSSTDRYDWFRISMTAGRVYYFSGSWSSYSDTYAELYSDSSGSNRVAYNDDSAGSGQFSFSYTAANTQTYYLRIRSYSVGSDSNYYLNYYYTAPQQNDAGSGGDAGNTFDTALYIPSGSYQGYLDTYDKGDYYKFTVTQGQKIYVEMTPPGGADFDLSLYDQNGNTKNSSFRSGSATDRVTYIAETSGTWYWRILVNQFTGSGTYTFNLDVVTPPDPIITISAPKSVKPGETFPVTISMNNIGGHGYSVGGSHLNLDAGEVVSVDRGSFDSYDKDTSLGTPWSELYKYRIEFYSSGGGVTFPGGSTKTGTVYIKAPESGTLTLDYRSWLRDKYSYIYRSPDDPDEPDGTATSSTKYFLDYATYSKSITVEGGTLSITTTPVSGAIYVDGNYVGTGDWTGGVAEGYHTITFGYVEGYVTPAPITVYVSSGETKSVTTAYTKIEYKVSISPESQSLTVSRGEPAIYTFTIKNEGTVADTYTLETSRGTLSKTAISLGPDETIDFTLTYESSASGIYPATIIANSDESLAMAWAYATTTVINQPPEITSLTADPSSVNFGGRSTIKVTASDPDRDDLTYSWSTTGGTFEYTADPSSVEWTAPNTADTYTITVTVSDGDKTDSDSIEIPVSKPDGATFEYEYITVNPQVGILENIYRLPSGAASFNLGIKNFGDFAAENISGTITIVGNQTQEISLPHTPSLQPGEEITFNLNINLLDGRYAMTLDLNYNSNNTLYTKQIDAQLILGDAPSVNIPQDKKAVLNVQSISNAQDYLLNAQNPDGSWESDALTTSIVLDTLLTTSENATNTNEALDYLESKFDESLGDVELTARMALAFSKANRTAKADEALNMLDSAKNDDGGWGYGAGYRSDPYNTLLVGKLHGESTWLAENLNTQEIFEETDVFATAQLVRSLAEESNMSAALEYLKQQENLTLAEKASTLSAFSKAMDISYASGLAAELEYLQDTDGSFGSPLETAFAVQALTDYYSTAVDLAIAPEDIAFNNTTPTLGDEVLINATLLNAGLVNASNVTVSFYDGNESIGNTTISIPANSTNITSVLWTALPGYRNISVIIDPENSIFESNESNNRANVTIFVNTPPSIALIYPLGGEFLSENVTVNWTAFDHDTDELNQSLYYGNSSSGPWSPIAVDLVNLTSYAWDTTQMQDGSYYLFINVTDGLAVNSNVTNSSFVIDNTLPEINITSPLNNSILSGTVLINGTVKDAYLANISVKINGSEVSNALPYNWNTSNYSDASYVVEVYAVDEAGNEASESIMVTVDNTAPTIEITAPANNSYIASKEVLVSWNASDNTGIAGYEIILDGTSPINTTETTETLTNLTEGLHNVEVKAYDHANNSASAFLTFTIDTLPPEISITGVVDEEYYNANVSANVEVSDANLNSTLTLLNDGPYAGGTTINEEGVYVLEVYADDLAGNAAFANLTFVIDKTPPEVNISSPLDGSYVRGIVEVNGAATDINLDAVSLNISGIEVANAVPYAWDTLNYSDGAHIIELTARDKANNTASASVTVYVDNAPPEITVASPLAQDYSYTQDITLDFNVSDDGSGLAWYNASLDGSKVVSGQIIDLSNFTLGEHTLIIEAADNLGNNATETVTFNVIDDVPPVVTLIEPEAGDYATVEDVTANFTAYDEKSGLASVTAEIDGSPVANGQGIDLASLDLGEHVFTATAMDASGNSASESITFTLVATQVEIKVTPKSKNVKENNNFDFMVHVRSDYSLSSLSKASTATFAEGYTVLAVLGSEKLNIKVDVGTLESRDYSFTLTSIGDVKVISNTVNVTVFVPGKKGKGKASNSTVKGKATSTKGKGKSDEKGKGKDKDKSESSGWDDDSGGDSGGGDSGSQSAGNQGQGKGKGKSGDKGNQGQGNENSNAGGNQGNSNKGDQGQGNAGGSSGDQGSGGNSGDQGQENSNSGSSSSGSSGNVDENQGSSGGDENSGSGSGDSNSGGQGQGNGGNSGESNSNAGGSSEGSQGNAGSDQGSNSGDSASGSSNGGAGSESSSTGGESSGTGDSGNAGGTGEGDSNAGDSSSGNQGSGSESTGSGTGSDSGQGPNSGGGSGQGSGNSGNQGGNSNSGGQGNSGNSGSSAGESSNSGAGNEGGQGSSSESQGSESSSSGGESSGSNGSGNSGGSGSGDSNAESSSGGGQGSFGSGESTDGNQGGGDSGNSGSGNNNSGGNGNSNGGGQGNGGNSGKGGS